MSSIIASPALGLPSYLKSLKTNPVEASIENLVSLLKRRQIRHSRPCAIATTQLLLRVVGQYRGKDVEGLLQRVRQVGLRLIYAQPREMVVGNIVRRILSLVREEAENPYMDDTPIFTPEPSQTPQETTASEHPHRPPLASSISTFSPLKHGAALPMDMSRSVASTAPTEGMIDSDFSSRPSLNSSFTSFGPTTPMVNSLFGIFSQPETPSPSMTPISHPPPGSQSVPNTQDFKNALGGIKKEDLKAEVLEGIKELLDELESSDDQIAAYALDHIHGNEMVLVHAASTTVQKFLLAAARKRKFTVVVAEGSLNDVQDTYDTVLNGRRTVTDDADDEDRLKTLHAAGIETIIISDAEVGVIMPRINSVILATHAVMANGALLAASGASNIALMAREHSTPVYVLTGVYKISQHYPFDDGEELIEYGDPGNIVNFSDGHAVDKLDIMNPLYDYVPADLVDLYITNLGGYAPSYLYRIVGDHYRAEDISLD